jgi:hypothetical protein
MANFGPFFAYKIKTAVQQAAQVGSPSFWYHIFKDHGGRLAEKSGLLDPNLGVFQNRLV